MCTDTSAAEAESNIPFHAAVSLGQQYGSSPFTFLTAEGDLAAEPEDMLSFELVHLCIAKGNSRYLRAVVSLF